MLNQDCLTYHASHGDSLFIVRYDDWIGAVVKPQNERPKPDAEVFQCSTDSDPLEFTERIFPALYGRPLNFSEVAHNFTREACLFQAIADFFPFPA